MGRRGGFSWSSLHGYYVEDYLDDKDAVLVSSQKVVDWRDSENVDPETNLSKELRERGIMLSAMTREPIAGKRRWVWSISPRPPATLPRRPTDSGVDDEDERPEGLR